MSEPCNTELQWAGAITSVRAWPTAPACWVMRLNISCAGEQHYEVKFCPWCGRELPKPMSKVVEVEK